MTCFRHQARNSVNDTTPSFVVSNSSTSLGRPCEIWHWSRTKSHQPEICWKEASPVRVPGPAVPRHAAAPGIQRPAGSVRPVTIVDQMRQVEVVYLRPCLLQEIIHTRLGQDLQAGCHIHLIKNRLLATFRQHIDSKSAHGRLQNSALSVDCGTGKINVSHLLCWFNV